jgi:hypothetical protein
MQCLEDTPIPVTWMPLFTKCHYSESRSVRDRWMDGLMDGTIEPHSFSVGVCQNMRAM